MDPQSTTPLPSKRRFALRNLATLLVSLSFLVLFISGGILFIAPSGQIAAELEWTSHGLGRADWFALHLTFSVLFVVFAVLYLIAHLPSLLRHLFSRSTGRLLISREAVIAFVVTVLLMGTSVLALPPASLLQGLSEHFRTTYWSDGSASPAQTGQPTPETAPEAAPDTASERAPDETPDQSPDAVDGAPVDPAAPLPVDHRPIEDGAVCSDCHSG